MQIRLGDVVKIVAIKDVFFTNISGTKEKPVRIIGIGSFRNSDRGLVLKNTSFIKIEGFSFNDFNTCIALINSSNVSLSNIEVSNCKHGMVKIFL